MDKTATQVAYEQRVLENSLGSVPDYVKNEEDYCRWAIRKIHERAQMDCEYFMKKLVDIEVNKPIKPIFISRDIA